MGIQEKAMLEYRKTMKRAKGMIAVLGLCMAVTGTSVSYAAGGTVDSGYESSQDAAVGDSADSGGGSFEAGDSSGGGGSGGGGSSESGDASGDSGSSEVGGSSGGSEAGENSGDSGDSSSGDSSSESTSSDSESSSEDNSGNSEDGSSSEIDSEKGSESVNQSGGTSETGTGSENDKNSTDKSNPGIGTGSENIQEPEQGSVSDGSVNSGADSEDKNRADAGNTQQDTGMSGEGQDSSIETSGTDTVGAGENPDGAEQTKAGQPETGAADAESPESPETGAVDAKSPESPETAVAEEKTAAGIPEEQKQEIAAQAAPKAAPAVQAANELEVEDANSTAIDVRSDEAIEISIGDNSKLTVIVKSGAATKKTAYTNANITSVKIASKTKISFRDPVNTENKVLDLATAIMELIAKQIELKPSQNVTLKVKELKLTAQDTGSATAGDVFLNVVKKVYDSDTTYAGIKNMTIVASGDTDDKDKGSEITITATNKASSAADSASAGQEADADTSDSGVWSSVNDKIEDIDGYLANVKNIETIIEIEDCSFTADTITLSSMNDLTMSTKSVGIGVAVNVANVSSAVLVKNSDFRSTKNIEMTAKSVIKSDVNADAKAGNIAVGVSVIGGTTKVSINSTRQNSISAGGDLILVAESNAAAATNALGKKTNSSQSGAFAGVSVINYDTMANIGGNVNVTKVENLKVSSTQHGVNGTTVKSVKSEEKNSSVKETALNTILGIINNSLENIQLTTRLKQKGSEMASDAKTKISSWFHKDEVEGKLSESLETASGEDSGVGSLFEEAEKEISNKIKLTFKDTTGKDVTGVTVKITPNEGTASAPRLWILDKSNVYEGTEFANGSYTITIIVPSGYAVPADQVIEIASGKGYNGIVKLAKTSNTKNQLVGAIAVTIVNSTNEASITTTGTINAGGKVEVLANAVSNNTTVADASTIPSGLENDADDNEFRFAAVTEDGSTTLPVTATLTKVTQDGQTDTGNPYNQTFLDKDGLIKFTNGATQNEDQSINGNQQLTAGKYKLVFKLPGSFGFAPKDMTGIEVTDETKNGTTYKVYTMYITLTANNTNGVKGLKQLITMKANGDTSGKSGTNISAGVAIGVGVVNNRNEAYISNATINAQDLTVAAVTGGQSVQVEVDENGTTKTETRNYDNLSSVSTTAGFNSGNFGLGGAVSVNVVNDITNAYISKATINIERDLSITASSKSNAATKAGSDDSQKEFAKSTGGGTAIGVGVVSNTTTADLEETTVVNGTGNSNKFNSLTVKAESEGEITVEAIAGAAGGKAIVPVVVVNILNGTTRAKVAANSQPVALVGNLTVYAKSNKKKSTRASGKAAGSSVAVGGAVTVSAGKLHQYAYMNRKVTGAKDISVKAESGNSAETISIAGANGADAPSEDDSNSDSSDDSDPQSPDNLVNKALASGKKVGSGTDGISETESKTPQSAETTEGKVTAAAAVAVEVWNDETVASVKADTVSSGKLEVIALAHNNVTVKANASSTLSTNGVGVSVAILVGNLVNRAEISGSHKTGYFLVRAGMPTDSSGKETANTIEVISISGAGASNVGVAGAAAINIFNTAYTANVNGNLTAQSSQESSVTAKVNQKITTKAGASADLEGAESGNSSSTGNSGSTGNGSNSGSSFGGSDKSVGVGASFGLTIADTTADAKVAGGNIKTAGNFAVKSVINSEMETYVEAGNDAYEDADGKSTSDKADRKYDSLDAAVSVSLVSSNANAEISSGTTVDTGGNLDIYAESVSKTETTAKGDAEAKNAAVGASVAVNLVAEKVSALLAGTASVDGNFTVHAIAKAQDLAKAYATASGVDLSRYEKKYNATIASILDGSAFKKNNNNSGKSNTSSDNKVNEKIDSKLNAEDKNKTSSDTSLSNKVLAAADVKTSEHSVDSGSTDTTGANAANAANAKKDAQSGRTGTTTNQENPVSVAAAVGVSIVSHDVSTRVSGTVKKAKTVTIKAENLDNFEMLATGAAVSKKNSIALGVAVIINNSKTVAQLTGNLGTSGTSVGEILIQAVTRHNMDDDYKTRLGAEAIAGAGSGGSGGFAVAGAVAVIVSNAETNASVGNDVIIYSNGNMTVEAIEQSKLAARAWGASLTDSRFNEQNGSGKTSGSNGNSDSKAGVGGAYAMIYVNNKTTAEIGDNAQITAKSLLVKAEKQQVSAKADDIGGNIKINGVIKTGSTQIKDGKVEINTTDDAQSSEDLKLSDLASVVKDLWNLLSNNNYYLEAVGGAASTENTKFTGAGSFTVLVINDYVAALVGKNVTLILTDGLTVKAVSKVNAVTIAGSVAYGGSKSAGVGINTIIHNSKVNAGLGDGSTVTGANGGSWNGDVTISASGELDLTSILVAAAASSSKSGNGTQAAGEGVVNIFVNGNSVTAEIGKNATIKTKGNVKVTAASRLGYTGITGGIAASGGHGIGASVSVIVVNTNTLTQIGNGANITAGGNLTVSADSEETIVAVIVNGAAAGSNGVAAAVSPAVNVIRGSTVARAGTGTYNVNAMSVTANSKTVIVIVSGGAAISSGKSGVGGSVQVNVFLKKVLAEIADGTSSDYAAIIAPGGLTVSADATEKNYIFVIGLGGGKSASVSGSIGVIVISNDVMAKIGDYTQIGNANSRGNVTVSAKDSMINVVLAGGFAGSASGAAVGLSNADVIADGKTQALIGDHATIYGNNVAVTAASDKKFINIVISGGVSAGGTTVTGSAAVVVVGDTVKAVVGKNSVINANGDVQIIALGSTDIIDIVGSLGLSTSGAAVGASIDTIVYQGLIYAGVGKGTKITTSNSGNVIVSAKSDDTLVDLVIGAAGGSSAAVNGSVAVIVAKQNVFALIGTPDSNNENADASETVISADGSIQVTAEAEQTILSGAGSAAISAGSAGVGAGVIVITDTHRTWAEAGIGAALDALGKNSVSGNFGKLTITTDSTSGNVVSRRGKHNQMTINGIIIGAFNTTNIHAIAVTGAGGSSAGVGIATVTVVEKAKSQAIINSGAKINQGSREGATGQSSVHVIASNDTVESVSGGAASGGGTAGVSGAVVVYTGIKETTARIGDGVQIFAENAIVVLAHSDNQIYANVIGAAAGGTAGVGATVSVIVLQDTTTASVGGTLKAGTITIQAESNQYLQLSATSIQGGGTAAAGASVGTIVFKGKTLAEVRPGATLIAASGDILICAVSKETIDMTVIGAGAGGTAAVNGSFAALVMNVTTQAIVGNGCTLNAENGTITVKAEDATSLNLKTGNVTVGGTAAIGAAIEVAIYRNTVTAMIGNNCKVLAKAILVQAASDRGITAKAVMAGAGGTASVNGSILVLSIGAATTDSDANMANTNGGGNSSDKASDEASKRGQAAVNHGYGQTVGAGDQNNQYVDEANSIINGLKEENKSLISGYFTSASVDDKTYAGIGDGGSTTATDGHVTVEATEKTKLDAIAGAAGGSGTASVGISMNLAIINGTAEARLGGTVRADKGNVKVHAQNILEIPNFISSGGGVAGSASVAGTITVIKAGEQAAAYIAPNANVYADGNVIVLAESAQDIRVINGNVSGGGAAGIGVATNVIVFSNKTHSYIGDGAAVIANANRGNVNFADGTTTSDVNKDYKNLNDKDTTTDYVSSKSNESAQSGVLVGAKSSQKIRSWVVSGAASGAVSVVGSVNVLVFGSETKAWIGKKVKVTANKQGDILVIAVDTTSIQDVVGNIAASSTVSAGISNDTITFQKVTNAYVDEGAQLTSGRNIIIKAISDEAYVVVVVSAGAAAGATPTGAVNGAVSTIIIKNETTAEVKANTADTILTTNGSIAIWAEDNQNLYVIAGSANAAINATGVSVSGAAGVAVVKASNTVQALVGKLAQLDAYGTTGITFYTGELDGNDGDRKRNRKKATQYGVLIGAFNTNNLMAITASGSAGTGAAGSIASTTVVSDTVVRAKVEQGAQINQKVKANREQKTSASSVKVIAMDSTEADTAAGGAAVGIAGATGTIVVTYLKKTVEAILNGMVYAPGGVDVLAVSDNNVFLLTTSLAGGLAGGAGSASVLYTENTVTSQLGGTIEAGTAAVNVKAINWQYITSGAASVSGGAVAVGGAGASIIFKSHTKAEVLDDTSIQAGSLNVNAQSKETITGVVAAATGGSTAVGGSLILIIANADTTARIGNNVTINLSGDLTVQAEDIVTIDMTAGTVSGGGTAVGGAAAVLIFKNTVLAEIGTNGSITAVNLNLTANSKRDITSYVVAGSAGVGAVSGSVLVILVGSKQSDDAKTAMKRDDTNNVSSNSQSSINEALKNANGLTDESLKLDITGYFTGETANATTARIGSGTVITLTGNANIKAAEKTAVTAYAGSVSGGGLAAGGSVAIAILNGTVQVEINGTINASGTVTINAENQITSNAFKAAAGSAGVIGLGAAVAYMDVTGTTKVLIGSTGSLNGKSGVHVSARLIINANPTADGYAGGWASAGMAAARLKVTGTTIVEVLSGSSLASINGNVKLNANQNITSTATTTAAGVGYGATGSVTLALVEVGSTTKVASGANVTASKGTYDILAHSILTATANAYGLSAAVGGSVQAAIARLTVKPVVLAAVTGGKIQAKNIRVRALFNVNDDESYSKAGNLESNAYAGAASGLVSGSGASSEIIVDGSATAEVTNATLTLTEDALVLSKANGSLTGNGAGLAAAGGAAVGGVTVKIENTFKTIAQITGTTIINARNISVLADYSGTVKGTAKGTAGGLLAAGTAQNLEITEDITTTAEIANSTITANGAASAVAQDEHDVNGNASGHSAAGFAAGGLTKITTKITNKTTARVTGSTITAQNILIQAAASINKDTTATASSGAFGGSVNDVSDDTTVNNQTYTEVGSGSKLTAIDADQDGDAIVIIAASNNSYKGYATAIAGAIIAKGVAKAVQNVTDDVRVKIYPSAILANKGNIKIYASAKDITSNLTAYGGAGGVAAGTNVKAEATTTANAVAEFLNGITGSHASVNAQSGDVFIGTSTNTEAKVYGRIKFTVDGLSHISTDVVNRMTINSLINLGSCTELSAAKNLDIQAVIGRIYAYASAYSETGSIINTQSKPNATVNVTANAKVTGTNVRLHAGQTLTLYAISTNDIYTNAYSYGYTAGGTGSVISTATNNTKVYGNVEIYGSDSSMNAKDIAIGAAAKSESEVSYTKKAEYKAETVTEFIKQTVTRTKNVIEKVSEKICKKLPWPLNKIVKWITKTIVKVITWVEEIVVEKILQSATDKKENGEYKSENNVILNGNIYYGSNADVNIVIDENGNIANSDVTYEKNGDNVIIKSFSSKANGSLKIESLYGKVSGTVKIHSNNVITRLNITNNSAKNLILKNIDLLAEYDADSCAYTILCSDYSKFVMDDVVDNTNQPEVTITTNTGKNVIFDGWFSYYTAVLNVLFNGQQGSVYFGDNAKLDVAKLNIQNAENVGTDGRPLHVNLFVTGNDDNSLKRPELIVDAAGNVYLQVGLKRYIEVQGTTTAEAEKAANAAAAKIRNVDKALIQSVNCRNVRLIMDLPKLLVGVLVEDPVTGKQTYTTTESVNTALNIVSASTRAVQEISQTLYEKTELDANGEWKTRYYTDSACTTEYQAADGKHVEERYDTTGFEYYLVTTDRDGNVNYQKLDRSAEYLTDEAGNFTGEVKVVINGQAQTMTLGSDDAIRYLKTLADGTYTDQLSKTFWLVDDEVTLIYKPAEGSSDAGEYDQIRYNKDTKKYEVVKAGTVIKEYDYITYDETKNQYVGVTVKSVEKTQDITDMTQGKTVEYEYDSLGTYDLGSINAGNDAEIRGLGNADVDINLTETITAGDDLTLVAGTVTRQGNQSVDLSAAGMSVQITKNFGTSADPIRVSVGTKGFNTAANSTGPIYLEAKNRELAIGSITSDGVVEISTDKAVKALDSDINIKADALRILKSSAVGTADQNLRTNISGNMEIISMGDIYVTQQGTAYVKNITSSRNNGTVSLTAGSIANEADGTTAAITASSILLHATTGSIGNTDKVMNVEAGNSTLSAVSDRSSIYLTDLTGNVNLGQLKAAGNIVFKTAGSIIGKNTAATVIAADADLTSTNGSIGTAESPLKTQVTSITAAAENGSIYLDNTGESGILSIGRVKAGSDIQITANGMTGTEDGDQADVTGENLKLTAVDGSIGTADRTLKVQGTTLDGDAAESIWLKVLDDMTVNHLTAQKGIELEALKNVTVKQLTAPEHILVKAAGKVIAGSIGNDDVHATTKKLDMIAEQIAEDTSYLKVKGYGSEAELELQVKTMTGVYIQDNSKILKLKKVSSDSSDVKIKTVGAMENGLEDTDTEANVTARNIVLEADTVGTDEKALTTNLIVDKSLDPAQNALIVKANGSINLHDIGTEGILPIAELSSANGGIFLRMDRSTAIESIKAENGSITSHVQGDYTVNHMTAGKQVNIYATGTITGNVNGTFTIGHVEAGTEDDRNDITFTVTGGDLLNGLAEEEEDQTNFRGSNITLTAKADDSGNIGNIGSSEHWITTETEGVLNAEADRQIWLKDSRAEGMLKLGSLKAADRITLTAAGDIVNGIPDQENSVNVSAEEISLRADGNIGAKDNVLLTKARNAALTAENIYLKNQGSLNLSKAEATADMELEVSGNLTSAGTTVKADHLVVKADNADLKTRVNEMTGVVSGNLALDNEGNLSVKNRLQAGDTVEIRTDGGTLDISGSLEAKNTKLSGADQVNVRVTDQIGNLDVATSESETSDISLDMESSSEKQQFTLATPGSVKLTTTMEDEQIDLFGNRVKIAGGANSALLQFSRIPGSLFVLVPGGNNRINVVTTMAETIIRTGNGSDTFILGGAVDDEEDMEYTFDYSGKNGGEAQSGMMGAGNQHKLDISTEGGENTWHLWMSGAPFYLEGGTGHDTFIRYTFTITDKDGNTKIFATPHYNISSKGGNITKIGFPSYGGNRRPVVSGTQGTWILTEAGTWQFAKQTGGYQTGWMYRGGKWWYFNEEGIMQTGWILSGGRWYYLLPGEGSMLTGWQQIDGVWYYFAPYDHMQYPAGSMFCQEQTPDGYSVDENGRWIA